MRDTETLKAVGKALYGDHWISRMAVRLAQTIKRSAPFSPSYIQKMAGGKINQPAWVEPALIDLIKEEITVREALLASIDTRPIESLTQ